jgi:hypothetical protein
VTDPVPSGRAEEPSAAPSSGAYGVATGRPLLAPILEAIFGDPDLEAGQ